MVGDGSLTGGVALEALNLAGHTKPDLLLVLNDNGRSYAPTVGGLQGHLGPLRLHPAYERLKQGIEDTLGRSPVLGDEMVEAAKRMKEGAKALVAPRTVFEDLGWQYAGPIDGHDLRGPGEGARPRRARARPGAAARDHGQGARLPPGRSTTRTTSTPSARSTRPPG